MFSSIYQQKLSRFGWPSSSTGGIRVASNDDSRISPKHQTFKLKREKGRGRRRPNNNTDKRGVATIQFSPLQHLPYYELPKMFVG